MSAPEFSRPHPVRSIAAEPIEVAVEANDSERAALAKRFDLLSLSRLAAAITLERAEGGISASGKVSAEAEQACVVTGDRVPATIATDFSLRFVLESAQTQGGAAEIELADDDCDIVYFTGDSIDLGEAASQTLALALDPFPRARGADEAARAAGILREDEAKPTSPFAALAGLKRSDDDAAS